MKILSMTQQRAERYFAKPLREASPAGACWDRVQGFFFCVIQRLCGYSDELMMRGISERLSQEFRLGAPVQKSYIPLSYVHSLFGRRFQVLFRESAEAYFQKQIDNGQLTLEELQGLCGNKRSWPRVPEALLPVTTLEKMVSTTPFSALLQLIPQQDRDAFMSQKPWQEFWTTVGDFLSRRGNSLQQECSRNFLRLFTREELLNPNSWKIGIVQKIVQISEDELPRVIYKRLQKMLQGLPVSYKDKIAPWSRRQIQIVNSVREECWAMQQALHHAVNVESTVCKNWKYASIEKSQEMEMYTAVGTDAIGLVKLLGTEEEVYGNFLHFLLQTDVIRDIWTRVPKGQRDEKKFQKVYTAWDRHAVDNLGALLHSAFLLRPSKTVSV